MALLYLGGQMKKVTKLIHEADHSPGRQWSLFSHRVSVRQSVTKLQNQATITSGLDCGLAKWIIDDSCLFIYCLQVSVTKASLNVIRFLMLFMYYKYVMPSESKYTLFTVYYILTTLFTSEIVLRYFDNSSFYGYDFTSTTKFLVLIRVENITSIIWKSCKN